MRNQKYYVKETNNNIVIFSKNVYKKDIIKLSIENYFGVFIDKLTTLNVVDKKYTFNGREGTFKRNLKKNYIKLYPAYKIKVNKKIIEKLLK